MIFKQLITNLGIQLCFKMSSCQSFCGFMYPLKMNHQNFTLEGTLKNLSGNPGILGIFRIAQSHIIHLAILIMPFTVQPNSDKYDVFYDLTI